MLLVDIMAGTLRRVPLAGLPLLTIYSIPVSLLGGGVSWIIFTLTTIGFLLMLYLQESRQIARWGRPLGNDGVDPSGFGVSNGALRSSAGAIGAAATALAIVVPLFIPTFGIELFGNGFGPGGGDKIKIENPTVDLKRDIQQGSNAPVITIQTNDPNPAYLRISVLNRFSDNEWSSGDRDVPTNNLPHWLGLVAAWNPVSAVAAAVRELWGNPNPSATISAWPMQHPVAAALIWSAVILAVCSVTATWLFKRRTTE